MGFDAFKDKISEKVNDVLGDEEQTDNALDRAEGFVNDKTGDKYADKVDQGRDFIDGKIGDERV
ncbi:antitoxin [Pseudactinotalea terrae]|uniref:antitoxin n=1 Tax=Pseudactinotalea terrae TaxID=1743262 RepID=UPI0012E0E439|nr:antitoxin [Pseudactinotalea terrae]